MTTTTQNADDFLFGGTDANDASLSVFDKTEKNQDGIYRPNLKDAKDKKIGYRATVRFLTNLTKDGKKGPVAIEKHVHYVDFKNEPGLAGYYDCDRNFKDKCEMCAVYWKLKNSKNAADVEKAELIKRTTKYYSYIMVIEDEQHPELVGKIMVFPYGYTIKEKINSERTGEVTGVQCNVFDLSKGKDFKLIIKDKAGFQNYDASTFLETSPIKLYDEKSGSFRAAPIDEDGIISNPKAQAKIKETLLSRTVELDDHKAIEWTEETRGKVGQVVSILQGEDVFVAESATRNAGTNTTTTTTSQRVDVEATTADDFFDLESEN
ncbi:hypothetical protein M0Q50_04025 [bacterium]|jgi:hypothetical protein|nr:hypothetical protein [bacterium]